MLYNPIKTRGPDNNQINVNLNARPLSGFAKEPFINYLLIQTKILVQVTKEKLIYKSECYDLYLCLNVLCLGDNLLSKVLRFQHQHLDVLRQFLTTLFVAFIPSIEVEKSGDSFVRKQDFSFERVRPHEDDPRKLRRS